MCGITGVVFRDQSRYVDLNLLERITEPIFHRGPDDFGYYKNKSIGFGFRRLSIIDLVSGHQPMTDVSLNYTIVFNGEIYNFKEKRDLLKSKGYKFKTHSDTEVLLNLYIEYGENCVNHLRGMFGFCIHDKLNNQIYCARDRFGMKPFYFHLNQNQFIFGSEIKSLTASGLIDCNLSYKALDSYFAYGYITNDLSIYSEINKLKAGNYFILDLVNWSHKVTEYWTPTFNINRNLNESQWLELIEDKFDESIKLHMISDVPIGSFLSGGIDSSGVTAFMSQNSIEKINTFSIGFKEEQFNELPYARLIAKKYKTQHFEKLVDYDSISTLGEIIGSFDEPFADSSAIPTYFVSKLASEHVKVILSGDGGDELFAGYNMYSKMIQLNRYNLSNSNINQLLFGSLNKLTQKFTKLDRLLYFLSKDKRLVGAYVSIFTQTERHRIFSDITKNLIGENLIEEYSIDILNKSKTEDFLLNVLNLNLKVMLADDYLVKVDRMSMANSLEVRVPLLDHEFAELAFTIPSNFKIKNGDKKYIFKKMLGKYLPYEIINHRKQGFAVPLNFWFNKSLKSYVSEMIKNKNSKIYDYLDYKNVVELLKSKSSYKNDLSAHIWTLVVFNEWLKSNAQSK